MASECDASEFWPAPPCGWHGACVNETVCVCEEGWSTVFPINGAQICFRDLRYMTFLFAARIVLGLLKTGVLMRELLRIKDRRKRRSKAYRLFWMLESEATGIIVSIISVVDPALQPFYNRLVTALDFSCVMGAEMEGILALDKFIRYLNAREGTRAPQLERGNTGIVVHEVTRRLLRVQMVLSLFSALVFLTPLAWADAMRVSFATKIASLVAGYYRYSHVLDPVLEQMDTLLIALRSRADLDESGHAVIERVRFKLQLGRRKKRIMTVTQIVFTLLSLLYMIWPFWMVTVLYNPSFLVFVITPSFLLDSYQRMTRERRSKVEPHSKSNELKDSTSSSAV
jgi:hypothetical protein